jgi:exoribonuclease R
MNNAQKLLSDILGVSQVEDRPTEIQGILQTKDYSEFSILDDTGNEIYRFTGAKLANKCLPGDHVSWFEGKCRLDLRDEHPPIVGTLELSNKSKFGLTSRGIYMYLFTPYSKRYPQFVVGCSEKDTSKNKIGLIKFDNWENNSTFPRGLLQQVLGTSGDFTAEKQALIWQASPWKYPKGPYPAELKEKTTLRRELKGFTFNIDPPGCKDIDDVLTFEKIDDSNWRVTITISDVAAFVEEGGVVDIYASLIGQTLYDNHGAVIRPMLPHEYSEQTCSLGPDKSSYGISLQFIWNGKEILEKEWFESMLKTDKSFTYDEFQSAHIEFREPLKQIASFLANEEKLDSHEWIEQCMIFYNTEAGKMLKSAQIGVLRKHSAPDYEKLQMYRTNVPELEKIAFSAAKYCLAEESETHHFGLRSDTYAHTSSPIRRYADLINQRALKIILRKSNERYIVPIAMYDMNYREKLNKNFSRDMDFLEAITLGQTNFKGIIIDTIKRDENVKVKIYIPLWKRSITTVYKYLNEETVLSRDEKKEINVSMFRNVDIKCAFNINSRNWKERIIINIL